MKLIERSTYLSKLKRVMGTPDIKVITGVRRCGKSKLLEAFKTHIERNIPDANVIHINFNLMECEPFKEYHALHDFIVSSCTTGSENFLLIDEVQMCPGFELAINSIHAKEICDIYLTGSNAFLLSSDLATLFTGRTYEIEVFPFSFSEFIQYFGITDPFEAFERFLKEGGMAGSYPYQEQEEKYAYVRDVFDTLIIRDIRQKYKIRNTILMERVADYLMDNISNLTSERSLALDLAQGGDPVDHKTISSYIRYLCNAYAFYRLRRYDIRGKKYLASSNKYYLSDHAFRFAKLGTKNMDYGRVLENMVAMELMRRGYEVYVGVLYKKEIDFVAMRHSEKIFIQVADNLSDEKTLLREVSPLLQIKEAFPKLVIARTRHEMYRYEGIQIVDIAFWLKGDTVTQN